MNNDFRPGWRLDDRQCGKNIVQIIWEIPWRCVAREIGNETFTRKNEEGYEEEEDENPSPAPQ